jgi:hypothetical protein
VTLGMLEDLGYGVVSVGADDWSVTNPGALQSVSPVLEHVQLAETMMPHKPEVFRAPHSPRGKAPR